jgi:hypothetical protein
LITESDRNSGQSYRYQHMTPIIPSKLAASEGIEKKKEMKKDLEIIMQYRLGRQMQSRVVDGKARHLVVSVSVLK